MSVSGAISLLNTVGINTTALGTSGDWEMPEGALGGMFVVIVTASSGFTSGFTVRIQGKDEVSGVYYQINATPTAITANGTYVYIVYPSAGVTPGAGSGVTAITPTCFLPPKGRILLNRTDGTYTITASLTPIMPA